MLNVILRNTGRWEKPKCISSSGEHPAQNSNQTCQISGAVGQGYMTYQVCTGIVQSSLNFFLRPQPHVATSKNGYDRSVFQDPFSVLRLKEGAHGPGGREKPRLVTNNNQIKLAEGLFR